MNKQTNIYILLDPRDRSIRYVGKAVNPHSRYRHRFAKHEAGVHKGKWLACLKALGLDPIMQIVEVVPATGDWVEAERWWIAHLQAQGHRLTNLSNGGEGELGRVLSAESCQKIAASLKGHKVSEETKAKLRAATKQQFANMTSEQLAEHIRKSQVPTTKEKRERCALAAKKRWDGHTIPAKVAKHRGCLPGETRRKNYGPLSEDHKQKIAAALKQHVTTLSVAQRQQRVQAALQARGVVV